MNSTTTNDLYRDLYDGQCQRNNELAFTIGWSKGKINYTIIMVESILKQKMPMRHKVAAIRAEVRELELLLKDIDAPEVLFKNRGQKA